MRVWFFLKKRCIACNVTLHRYSTHTTNYVYNTTIKYSHIFFVRRWEAPGVACAIAEWPGNFSPQLYIWVWRAQSSSSLVATINITEHGHLWLLAFWWLKGCVCVFLCVMRFRTTLPIELYKERTRVFLLFARPRITEWFRFALCRYPV